MLLLLLVTAALAWPPDHVVRMPEAPPPVPPVPADADPVYAHGAMLYRAAGCVGCHSPPFRDATHLGGGRDLPTVFGTFYAPNISPDPTHGIGTWTEADFDRALRRGRAPDGHRYWPTFPYMAYTKLHDDDLRALWVYVSHQPAVPTPDEPHEIKPSYELPGVLGLWRMVAFHRGQLPEDPKRSAAWNRGNYLVHAVGYCDQCHTPRGRSGLMKRRHAMAGGANPAKGDIHPNLTSDASHGIGTWTEADIVRFLTTGDKPGGGHADPHHVMDEKIRDSFSWLPDADKHAIAVYLKALPPDPFDPYAWTRKTFGDLGDHVVHETP